MPHMNIGQRATQLWSILAFAAHNRQVLTYGVVAKLTGLPPTLGQFLEPIQSYCLLQGLEPLTVIVVNRETGLPGGGFVAAENISKAQQDVFSYDWLEHGCPSPEEFEKAVKERPSNGVPSDSQSAAENFNPVEIPGESLSATILDERR